MSSKKKPFNCPAELTVSLIGGKWKAILLFNLRKSPKRFGELKRLSPGITSAMLSTNLKELEDFELVKKNFIGKDRLNGVEYRLTARGETLKPIINSMIRWGISHQKEYVMGEFGMNRM